MARPIKEGLNYFPLDVDITQDDKIAMIEALHGNEGFAVTIKLLAKIYKEGYFYTWSKREQLLFSKNINVDINSVNAIVNTCIDEGLFNKKMYETYEILTSKGIQLRYLEAIKRRKEARFFKKYFLVTDVMATIGTSKIAVLLVDDNENEVNVNINSIDSNISTQRKEEKRKEEKRIITTTTNPVAVVIQFWDQNGFGANNTNAKSSLLAWLDDFNQNDEIIVKAMEIAAANNKRNLRYVEGILKRWNDEGFTTLSEIEQAQEEFENKKTKTGTHTKQNAIQGWEALKK